MCAVSKREFTKMIIGNSRTVNDLTDHHRHKTTYEYDVRCIGNGLSFEYEDTLFNAFVSLHSAE